MNRNIVIISDFKYEEIPGGAESNDKILKDLLSVKYNVFYVKTQEFNEDFKNFTNIDLFIISNFYFISEDSKNFLSDKKYIIIEHDYKFLKSRNPNFYDNLIAPSNEIVHQEFYEKALLVLVQSKLQKSIFKKNINLKNLESFSGNLWDEESISLLKDLCNSSKNGKAAVLDSDLEIKGTKESINFCEYNKIAYDKIPKQDYRSFLRSLSKYSLFVFFPLSPETFSRVTIEAKMMNLAVITNGNTAAIYEDLYKESGINLINLIDEKKQDIISIIEKFL